MGEAIDRISTLLASGASRRELLAATLAAGSALLPWTAAAKAKKEKRRERRRIVNRAQEYCQYWCNEKFTGNESAIQSCINAARDGKGACYSAAEKGPGHFCLRVKDCGEKKYCCPSVLGGLPVTEGACCAKGTVCGFVNGTVIGELCEV